MLISRLINEATKTKSSIAMLVKKPESDSYRTAKEKYNDILDMEKKDEKLLSDAVIAAIITTAGTILTAVIITTAEKEGPLFTKAINLI